MPGITHEVPIELLQRNPRLAAALLEGVGVAVPAGAGAVMTTGDVGSVLPAELRADAVVMLSGGGSRLAVVVEVQTSRRTDKRRVWPAYLALARARHDCPTVLLVICPDTVTGAWARRVIPTGHPGFDLAPLVIDARSVPDPGNPALGWAAPELAVLAALTGAADLEREQARRDVLAAIAAASGERLETYTRLVRAVASAAARDALEALMTTMFKDDFVDRIKAEGRAEGQAAGRAEGQAAGRAEGQAAGRAAMVLRILAARGLAVPALVRDRVLACTDLAVLEGWADKAITATRAEDILGG